MTAKKSLDFRFQVLWSIEKAVSENHPWALAYKEGNPTTPDLTKRGSKKSYDSFEAKEFIDWQV